MLRNIATALVIATSLLAIGEQVKPLDNAGDVTGIGSAPSERLCPEGWQDTSQVAADTIVQSCSRGGWLVIVNPDGSMNYAWDGKSPDFEFDPSKVPSWR